jgi:hypothetical protein
MMGSICDRAALKVGDQRLRDVEFGPEATFDGALVYGYALAAAHIY